MNKKNRTAVGQIADFDKYLRDEMDIMETQTFSKKWTEKMDNIKINEAYTACRPCAENEEICDDRFEEKDRIGDGSDTFTCKNCLKIAREPKVCCFCKSFFCGNMILEQNAQGQ